MTIYDELALIADDLITEFGQSITIQRPSSSGDAWNPNVTYTDYTADCVLRPVKAYEANNELIQLGDVMATVQVGGVAITPKTSDKAVVDGVTYQIVQVWDIAPAGTSVVYKLQLRR